jgi:hypothetical protein
MAGEAAFFELGVEDVERGRSFYEGLFGWRFEPGPSGEGYSIGGRAGPGRDPTRLQSSSASSRAARAAPSVSTGR